MNDISALYVEVDDFFIKNQSKGRGRDRCLKDLTFTSQIINRVHFILLP